jgi:hypothetical protein
MASVPTIDNALRRLNVALAAYIILCALHQFSHGMIDDLWARSGQITFLVIFGLVPMVGTMMLWKASLQRVGGIVVLGSVPAAALFLLVNRYVDKHICMYPIETSAIWTSVYEVTFFLMILGGFAAAFVAAQFLRAFHAATTPPLSE